MIQFVTTAFRDMKTVGTVCPSWPALCKALTRGVRESKGPIRVLEVGPGTGPVTRYLLRRIGPGDVLDVVELNDAFAAHMEREVLAPWRAAHPGCRVTLHHAAIQDAQLQPGSYDFVVSGLPFNNFDSALVESILSSFMDLLKPGGELRYFGYLGAKRLKGTIGSGDGRRNIARIRGVEDGFYSRHAGTRTIVLPNIPPAEVRCLRKR
jgi:phospholipid N-methyltransferase